MSHKLNSYMQIVEKKSLEVKVNMPYINMKKHYIVKTSISKWYQFWKSAKKDSLYCCYTKLRHFDRYCEASF